MENKKTLTFESEEAIKIKFIVSNIVKEMKRQDILNIEKDDILFSVKTLALKWGKTEECIRKYVKDGILTPCSGVPGMMFSRQYISKLEDVELERFSPLERKKLEIRIRELENDVETLSKLLMEHQTINLKSLSVLNGY